MSRRAALSTQVKDEETIKGIIEKVTQELITKNDMEDLILKLEEKMELLPVNYMT